MLEGQNYWWICYTGICAKYFQTYEVLCLQMKWTSWAVWAWFYESVCMCLFTQGRRCVLPMCVSLLQCCEGWLGGVTLLRGWGGCGTRNCGKNHKDRQRLKWAQRSGRGQRSNKKGHKEEQGQSKTEGGKEEGGREKQSKIPPQPHTETHRCSLQNTGTQALS